MIFGLLFNRKSLRGLAVTMETHARKLYNIGFGKSVIRSNLSKSNEEHDYLRAKHGNEDFRKV